MNLGLLSEWIQQHPSSDSLSHDFIHETNNKPFVRVSIRSIFESRVMHRSGHALDFEYDTSKRHFSGAVLVDPPSNPPEKILDISKIKKHAKAKVIDGKHSRDNANEERGLFSNDSSLRRRKSQSCKDIFRPYGGDVFGTHGSYVDGLLYRSRMKKSKDIPINGPAPSTSFSDDVNIADEEQLSIDDSKIISGHNQHPKNESNRRYAVTMKNWSLKGENITQMVSEGAVDALMKLVKKSDDYSIHRLCVSTLMNISNSVENCKAIVEAGAVPTIVQLAMSSNDERMQYECTVIICNLSCLNAEASLVGHGLISALVNLMAKNDKNAALCQWATFNFTCVQESYNQIERVIKCFISLANSNTSGAKEVCSLAFCNLSRLKRARVRLVEEGITQAIVTLVRGRSVLVKKSLAAALSNLSSTKACRSEMIVKGALSAINVLSSFKDSDVLFLVARTICQLSDEASFRLRIITENALDVLSELGTLSQDESIMELCALSLYKLTQSKETHERIIDRNGLNILNSLAGDTDSKRKEYCTLSMCNLLSVPKAASGILRLGAVKDLLKLSRQESIKTQDLCSIALFNLCLSEVSSNAVSNYEVIPAIMRLSFSESMNTKIRCAAALWRLTYDEETRDNIVEAKVIPTLFRLLSEDKTSPIIERYCTATLCVLSQHETCANAIVGEGAVEKLIAASFSSDFETKASSGAVLASLTFHAVNRIKLVDYGIIHALSMLANLREPAIQRRCAAAFGNLSCEYSLHQKLIDGNIVQVLSGLSNSYSEENQKDCAKALCNISCSSGREKDLIDKGALETLMMIGMVRSISPITKETCLRAFLNLLIDETIEIAIQKGVVEAFVAISCIASPDASRTCALLFRKVTSTKLGRRVICSKNMCFQQLYTLMNRKNDKETLEIVGQILLQLIYNNDSRDLAVTAGVVPALMELSKINEQGSIAVSSAFFILSTEGKYRTELLEGGVQHVIVLLLGVQDNRIKRMSLKTLFNLASCESSRKRIIGREVIPPLVELVYGFNNSQNDLSRLVVSILCHLCFLEDHRVVLLNSKVLQAIADILEVGETFNLSVASIMIHELSKSQEMVGQFCEEAIRLICKLSLQLTDMESIGNCADTFLQLSMVERTHNYLISPVVVSTFDRLISNYNEDVHWRIATCFELLSSGVASSYELVQLGATKLVIQLARDNLDNPKVLTECGLVFENLSKHPNARYMMVEQGAVSCLIDISKRTSFEQALAACAVALSNLSSAPCKVEAGTVSALITMSSAVETFQPVRANAESLYQNRDSFPPSNVCSKVLSVPIESLENNAKFEIYIESSISSEKHPANIEASSPPPPHVPTLKPNDKSESDLKESDMEAKPYQENDPNGIPDRPLFYDKVVPQEKVKRIITSTDDEEDEAGSTGEKLMELRNSSSDMSFRQKKGGLRRSSSLIFGPRSITSSSQSLKSSTEDNDSKDDTTGSQLKQKVRTLNKAVAKRTPSKNRISIEMQKSRIDVIEENSSLIASTLGLGPKLEEFRSQAAQLGLYS